MQEKDSYEGNSSIIRRLYAKPECYRQHEADWKHFLSAPKGKCYCLGHNNFHIHVCVWKIAGDGAAPLSGPVLHVPLFAPERVTGRCLKNYRLLASYFSVWLVQARAGLLEFSKTSERSYTCHQTALYLLGVACTFAYYTSLQGFGIVRTVTNNSVGTSLYFSENKLSHFSNVSTLPLSSRLRQCGWHHFSW